MREVSKLAVRELLAAAEGRAGAGGGGALLMHLSRKKSPGVFVLVETRFILGFRETTSLKPHPWQATGNPCASGCFASAIGSRALATKGGARLPQRGVAGPPWVPIGPHALRHPSGFTGELHQ